MRKFTVVIEETSAIINLQESLIVNSDSYILLKIATIFWDYNNVHDLKITYNDVKKTLKKGYRVLFYSLLLTSITRVTMIDDWDYNNVHDLEITYNNVKKTLKKGYWTFDLIKKEIESYGNVTMESNKYDCTATITSDQVINLKDLGPILGFPKDKIIPINTTTRSDEVDINRGLKHIKLHCNLIYKSNNILNGKKSDVLTTLSKTSKQSVKGSVQHFFDIDSRIMIKNNTVNQNIFSVTDQDNILVNVDKILLGFYIM